MFVDASALVAIISGEPDATALTTTLRAAEAKFTSAIAIYETTLAVLRIRQATMGAVTAHLDQLLGRLQIKTVPITAEIGRLAIDAFARFGRGNHPARLNMGDCFAYACAHSLGVPLLCKGGDFSQTDIAIA